MPTINPEMTNKLLLALMSMLGSVSIKDQANGANIKPKIKAMRHAMSFRCGLYRPPTMPQIPAILPFNKMNRADAMPSSAPPASADQGVN